jgi:hypothetical protein
MSLNSRLADLATALGTDYKQLRVWLTGSSTGTLSSLTTTAQSSIVAAINEVNSKPVGNTPGVATETVAGVAEVATTAEVTAGTADNFFVTPLKLAARLLAYAQPLSANLTTLAGVASGAFGRTLLGTADAASARTALQLSAVAVSGSASDITTGTLPTSVLPPLAINDTFPVASQAAMLALTAQRGDVAVRTDIGRNFVLAAEGASTLANWVQLLGGSDVSSVAGRTGAVVLVKGDVGLGNVDNTADSAKPVSTAQAAADNLRLLTSNNLSELTATASVARGNIGAQDSASIGNADADLVALYTTAKA